MRRPFRRMVPGLGGLAACFSLSCAGPPELPRHPADARPAGFNTLARPKPAPTKPPPAERGGKSATGDLDVRDGNVLDPVEPEGVSVGR